MAQDWAADVKRYDPNADDGIIAGIVRYCGIALQKRDSSLVSMGDPVETGRVRENFLKKKLALADSDETLNAAIAAIGTVMKGDNFKNRVTVYYLLAQHFGKLGIFDKSGGTSTGSATTAAAAGTAAMGLANLGDKADQDNDAPAPISTPAAADGASGVTGTVATGVAAAAGAASAAAMSATGNTADAARPAMAMSTPEVPPHDTTTRTSFDDFGESEKSGGMGWLMWLLLGLLALTLIWWFLLRAPAEDGRTQAQATASPTTATDMATTGSAADTAAAGTAVDLAAAPVEGSVAIPDGAGVTSELRDGKPVVKVYFDTSSAAVVPAFAGAAGGLNAWLAANPGSSLAVSGFNDATGNAAANAELSKNRAQAVRDALIAAGVSETSVELVKPTDATQGVGNDADARRVEVVVR